MSENRFYVRAWILEGVVRFVNSNELPIQSDIIDVNDAQVYDLSVIGDYMLSDAVMEQLSVVDGRLDCGLLNVDEIKSI